MIGIKDENYYVIQGWMRTKLGLKGNELLVYAMLWSFSQDGISEFRGALSYMSEFIGSDERTVRRSLDRLEMRGYIEKEALNEVTGKSNGYKCIPLEQIDFEKVGWTKCPPPRNELESAEIGWTKCPGGLDKMSDGLDKMSDPLTIEREVIRISKLYKKESKKEIKEKQEQQARAPVREIPKFSKMSDEEFMKFGETHVPDFTDEFECEIFDAYLEEMERRKEIGEKWEGKVVRRGNGFERLESHSAIMKKYGVGGELKSVLEKYLRFCWLNRRMITNEQLEELLFDLTEKYSTDELSKIQCIEKALKYRWFAVVV